MLGWQFSKLNPDQQGSLFDKLFSLFQDLLLHTAGNVDEALNWLTELDREYKLTTPDYGIADFIDELIERGFLQRQGQGEGMGLQPTAKMEAELRNKSLQDVFGNIKKSQRGQHISPSVGTGDEHTQEIRPFEFGDKLEQLDFTESLKNAYIQHGIDDFAIHYDDLLVQKTYYQSRTSTVLMIDISHSMILYGEDRITPAKKVAMALAEYIRRQYPTDTLDVIVFGNDAWRIEIKDLPYLEVGPYHTNTVAGLELAMDILRRRRNPNQQIFMITDGKPTCIKKGKNYYKNSWGLDRKIISRTLTLAQRCQKLGINVTTFMIAQDPYLVRFVEQFTQAARGKAFYSSLQGLGDFVFRDYKDRKK